MKLLKLSWDLQVHTHANFKSIIIFHAEIIEVVISNLRPFIDNKVIIRGFIFRIAIKVPGEVLVP